VLVLSNLSLILYWTQVFSPRGLGVGLLGPLASLAGAFSDPILAEVTFLLNALALAAWEYLAYRGVPWVRGRTFPRVTALLALFPVLFASMLIALGIMFQDYPRLGTVTLWSLAAFIGASLYYYRFRVHDLFILTASILSAIVWITTLVGRIAGGGVRMALVMAVLLVGLTTWAALRLRQVAEAWEEEA
jgi:uncharacterized membrane protein